MTVRLRPLSRGEVRQLDLRASTELGLPTSILMENAGRGAAAWLAELTGLVSLDRKAARNSRIMLSWQ
jgi:NAD(P)H-hydrate repair Nnr-like enzyme with NAD(P)H-hydrate epimerase domain